MDRDWRRQYGVVPDIQIEKGYMTFPFPQSRPIPWAEFAPLAERSLHKVKRIEADLEGAARDGVFTLAGSGETLVLEGAPPPGATRLRGVVRLEAGKTVLKLP